MKKIFKATFLHTLAMLPLAAFCLHGQAIAEPKNTASRYEGQSLCDAGDDIYTSCPTHTGKILSICGTTKQAPNIMYVVYGTPKNISLTSPKVGTLPLRIIFLKPGKIFYFTENGKQHIAYAVYADSDDDMPLEGNGLITQRSSDHQITNRDFCVKETIFTNDRARLNDYQDREEKDPSHISKASTLISPSIEHTFYEHMHPR